MNPSPGRPDSRAAVRQGCLRTGWRPLRWLAAGYLLMVLLAMLFEESLIFFPAPYPEGDWQPAGLDFEDAWFEAADGVKLHGWYVPHKDARATVLFCHGNAGNLSHRIELLQVLHRQVGVSVLILDYRGYGRSEGTPNEAGVMADARAARTWLAGREQIAETDVVLMGRSLGGAVATVLAAEDGARALVLESTFSSIPDVAAHYYPWLPVRWALRTRLDAAGRIGGYHGPLLQSHGDADTIIPYEFGCRLFEAANEPKQFIALAGAGHNELPPTSYYDELADFLESLPE